MISQQIFTPNTLIGFFLLEGSAFNTVELNICSKPDLLPQMEAGKSRNFTAANGGRIFAQVIVVVTHISVYIEIWTSIAVSIDVFPIWCEKLQSFSDKKMLECSASIILKET